MLKVLGGILVVAGLAYNLWIDKKSEEDSTLNSDKVNEKTVSI